MCAPLNPVTCSRVGYLTKGVAARGLRACPAGRAVNAASVLMKHFLPHGPGHGTPEFLRRQRLLALCGWGVQQLRAHGAAGPGSGPDPSSSPASTTPAADAALVCALCGAKAGMWQFVPRVAAACSSLSGAGVIGLWPACGSPWRTCARTGSLWGGLVTTTISEWRCAWVGCAAHGACLHMTPCCGSLDYVSRVFEALS